MRADGLATLSNQQISTLRNGLRIMALRALGDADVAEDAVQETLVRALDAVTPEMAADPARLGAFAGGIARHVIADIRRRQLRVTTFESDNSPISDSDTLAQLVQAEARARLRAEIAKLSRGDQAVLHASFYEGLTPSEIAERSRESAEVVRKRKSRALSRLREILERAGHIRSLRSE